MNIIMYSQHIGVIKYIETILMKSDYRLITVTKLEQLNKVINDIKNCVAILIEMENLTEKEFNIWKSLYQKTSVPVFLFSLGKHSVTKIYQNITNVLTDAIPRFSKKLLDEDMTKVQLRPGLVFDLEGFCLMNEEESFQLTAQEYKILTYLCKNQERFVTSKEIITHLNLVGPNSLYVYIKRLREKIEVNPKKPNILLVKRGKGYILNIFKKNKIDS
ncbi:winged helix-turn-helix domain-containing protein [Lihuaxuella thermophila]|uniref:Two-component system, OmpR family, response regulator VicR n=1 Tax=Lihuaxuella thermophila TaxID=1173111 RepID=A0A1H8G6B7_9BACL|nr:winged helix-turn-helix domain-containing protein [Lihuaxuella thermophila]SEN39290.1 two-component system, OmpR family, response regulator VicR [Lihuaxuella thermophila]